MKPDLPEPIIPAAKRHGILTLGKFEMGCCVLENETRVISQRGLMQLLGFSGRGNSIGHRLASIITHPGLNSLRFKNLALAIENPVKYYTPNGVIAYGYSGELIIDYCRAILDARKSKVFFGPAFERYAEAAESLVSSVAKVGITALIDEATGFQDTRERDALQVMLDKFLRQEFAAWAKRFPDEFYQELFRLKKWKWKGMKVNRPQVVGYYTNDLIYGRLAPHVLEELQKLNPANDAGLRHHRHHQHLTHDVGHPALQQHLFTVMAFMRASATWDSFKRLLDRSLPKFGDTFGLALNDDELNPGD